MIFDIRTYYRRIANLTRSYLRNRYYDLGQADELFDRLYLEYLDLGTMLHLNFGRANEDQYSQLLGQFVIDLRELISAQIAGDTEGINQNLQRLNDNIDARAAFLASINPYWSADEYKYLFGTYFQLLMKDANSLSSGNFNEDIALYEPITELTNSLGDTFAEGVYNYITSGKSLPAQEGERCISYEQMRTIQNITTFWFDLEVWMRSYMLSKYLKVGDVEADYNRLEKVIVDYTNEIKKIYGEKFAADLLQYLNEYLDLFDNYTTAQMAGNVDEVNRIIPLLYQNAASRAALQASVNTFLSEDEWRKRLYDMQVQGMINESTAILSGDITRSLDIYIDLLTQAENIADYFERALFNYFTQTQENQQQI
jgi:hypothetical protein